MRPSQQARKALSMPDVLFNLAYWENVKQQIMQDLLPLIEAKAQKAIRPSREDLLHLPPDRARQILHFANEAEIEANTLYAVKVYMEMLFDACYQTVIALNESHLERLNRVEAIAADWEEMFYREQQSHLTSLQLADHYATLQYHHVKKQSHA